MRYTFQGVKKVGMTACFSRSLVGIGMLTLPRAVAEAASPSVAAWRRKRSGWEPPEWEHLTCK